MRSVLIAASVLASALVLFVSGMVAATMLVTSGEEPHRFAGLETGDLWTTRPVAVDRSGQAFERLPDREVFPAPKVAGTNPPKPVQPGSDTALAALPMNTQTQQDADTTGIDLGTTGAVGPQTEENPAPVAQLSAEHVAWCSSRYRSYNQQDNSYRPYSGGNQPCISPYGAPASVTETAAVADEDINASPEELDANAAQPNYQEYEEAFDRQPQAQLVSSRAPQGDYAAWQHEENCFARYRSYRPEDNSYQPYEGGPRRQCE